ncbi:MAG TPA: MFS transporter [Acidimicrobiia bacterium]|nr:MFS transporter [Acidimicrobiia bacterium]
MRRVVLVTIGAPPERVRAALATEAGFAAPDGPFTAFPFPGTSLRSVITPFGDGATALELEALGHYSVPFFSWFVELQAWLAARRELPFLAARVEARALGTAAPPTPRPFAIVPPVAFSEEQARRLAALALVAVFASFSGALLTQNGDAVTDTFNQSDQALGLALAIARAGVLLSLVVVALADRLGRRRLILIALAGACAANALAGLAPSFEVFTGAQLLTRAFVNACLVVAGIAAVEEAPEGARAFAAAMFALALGAGVALSVVFLPFADLGDYGWRISFLASAAAVLLLPAIGRQLHETRRYAAVVRQRVQRGRVGEVFVTGYRGRFVLLAAVAFVTNVFTAPSSQLTNRYLHRAHRFSNSDVALFRTVTAGVPGVIGILLAGRLAESRGRRPVAVAGLLLATAFQMAFFLASDDVLLWVAPAVAIVAAASAGLALGTLDAELFPTEVRGTSNGLLLVAGVAGSATGLLVATQLRDAMGGLGAAIAVCGIPTLVAAVLLVPRLPETVARRLDDVSPTEA